MRLPVRATAALGALALTLLGTGAPAHADPAACDVACQWQAQQQNALPRTAFYDAPDPLRPAPAGTLIRRQTTADYRVAGATVTATRVLYHSRTSGGRDVAASGVVVVPPGRAPRGGWPVVADAHGSSGIGVPCAPSLMHDLYHGNQIMRFVDAGYAVVAPDYAGLGTDGRDELVNKTSESTDVLAAVAAAHQLGQPLSARWVLWGHSQGGGAALAVAERQVRNPAPGYLGTVVTSPTADLAGLAEHVATSPGYGAFAALLAVGAHASDPAIRVDRLLTPAALARVDVTATGCLGVSTAAYADLTGAALVAPGYRTDPRFTGYLRANSTGRSRVAGPVLLLQGDADTVVPESVTDGIAAGLCRSGARLDYRTYPGLEHDTYPWVTGIDDGAMPDILAWTADRFAGRPAPTRC